MSKSISNTLTTGYTGIGVVIGKYTWNQSNQIKTAPASTAIRPEGKWINKRMIEIENASSDEPYTAWGEKQTVNKIAKMIMMWYGNGSQDFSIFIRPYHTKWNRSSEADTKPKHTQNCFCRAINIGWFMVYPIYAR